MDLCFLLKLLWIRLRSLQKQIVIAVVRLPKYAHSSRRFAGFPIQTLPIFALALSFQSLNVVLAQQETANQSIDFASQIRPILSDYCFACHGPDSEHRAADLRFDDLKAVIENEIIVPSHPADSEFWLRISTDDEDLIMPPLEAKKPLSEQQKQLLKTWIQQGAPFSGHWAFEKPHPQTPPAVEDHPSWNTHPIDAFVLQQMQARGLSPSPTADRRTLIRRLSMDLTGLPPTRQQIHAFLEDPAPDAYQQLVDRLLASPRFGERMASNWLDQARYADTNGYSIDGGRNMWIWRDWVIRAYNENLPYDQFLTWQLAGDLLPDPSTEQLVATGFNRNHSITHEGGTIPAENLVNYVADRVKTTGESVMGLTLGCAQCHDHKFDPISQEDYYRIFAYFNTLDDRGLDGDGGRNSVPAIQAPWMLPDAEQEIATLQQQLEQLNQRYQASLSSQEDWEEATRQVLRERGQEMELIPLEMLKVTEPNRGEPFDVAEDGTVWVPTPSGRSPSFSTRIPHDRLAGRLVTGLRVQFLPDDRLPHGGLGHGNHPQLAGNFLLTSFSCSATSVPSDQLDLYRRLEFAQCTASSNAEGHPPKDCLDPRDHNGWAPQETTAPQHITFTFSQPLDPSDTPFLTSMLVWGGGHGLLAGKYRFFAMVGNDDGSAIPDDIQQLLLDDDQASPEEKVRLKEFYATIAPELAQVRADIATLQQRIADIQSQHSVMVMNTSAQPRKTHILNRGQYDQPGEEVQPGTPASLPQLGSFPANRRGLAQWLTHPDHPLTSRVAVNRYWQQFFGRGIVHPTADFGLQGAPPTHPELLDYLAVQFVENGWDTKSLIRLMVTSQTYQQQSAVSASTKEGDPLNLWLSHAPRFRYSAEVIRDSSLFVGDLLVERLGGRPVFPYQPEGLWREVSHFGSTPATAQVFVADEGEKLYRRSLYTFWKRTVPPPSMQTFDAPNREICTMDRPATNTPLQALVLLNDIQFVEAARGLAQRTLNNEGNDRQRLSEAFEITTSRLPTDRELEILAGTLNRERERFSKNPDQATALIQTGDSLPASQVEASELAAWTVVCQLILNLSETLTRG